MRFGAVIAVDDDGGAGAAAAELAAVAGVTVLACDVNDAPERSGDGGQLVVLSAHLGGRGRGPLDDRATEDLLCGTRSPVLVLGAGGRGPRRRATLLLAVDATADAEAALPAVERWAATFGIERAEVIGFTAPDPWPDDQGPPAAEDRPAAVAALLAERGVPAGVRRVATADPAGALVELSTAEDGAVPVVVSPRWPDHRSHWYGTVRDLLRRARGPVMIVASDA